MYNDQAGIEVHRSCRSCQFNRPQDGDDCKIGPGTNNFYA